MEDKTNLVSGLLCRFRADDMFHLSRIYTKFDQPIFKNGRWSYNNPCLVINKIKSVLETIPDDCFDENGLMWKREILWFWHHHAISIAVSRGDIALARIFADRALKLQGRNPCNQITRLLWHLVHGRIKQARRWFRIGVKVDRKTARDVLHWYDEGYFSNRKNPKIERRKKHEKKLARRVSTD
jgi:hypothetical protein